MARNVVTGARLAVYHRNYSSCAGATWLCGEIVYARGGNCSARTVNLLLQDAAKVANRSADVSPARRKRGVSLAWPLNRARFSLD